jgi:hypothetical protein
MPLTRTLESRWYRGFRPVPFAHNNTEMFPCISQKVVYRVRPRKMNQHAIATAASGDKGVRDN